MRPLCSIASRVTRRGTTCANPSCVDTFDISPKFCRRFHCDGAVAVQPLCSHSLTRRLHPHRSGQFTTGTIRRSKPGSGHDLTLHHMLKIAQNKKLALRCEMAEHQLNPGHAELSRRAESGSRHPAADQARVPKTTGLVVLGLVQPRAPR